jgi:hypothetical protein
MQWTPQDLILLHDAGVEIDPEILDSVVAYVVARYLDNPDCDYGDSLNAVDS